MKLSDWRKQNKLTLLDVANRLGIGGKNPSRTVQRFEQGSRHIDADLAEAIAVMTGDAVRPEDHHEVRLEWLRANRQCAEAAQ